VAAAFCGHPKNIKRKDARTQVRGRGLVLSKIPDESLEEKGRGDKSLQLWDRGISHFCKGKGGGGGGGGGAEGSGGKKSGSPATTIDS